MNDKNERYERLPALRRFLNFPLNFPWAEEDLWGFEDVHQSGLAISEDKDHVYVEAHLPGLKPENIEVTFEKGMLWIRGERKGEEEDKKRNTIEKHPVLFPIVFKFPACSMRKKSRRRLTRME